MAVGDYLSAIRRHLVVTMFSLIATQAAIAGPAADLITLTIKNQAFIPQILTVKAGTPVKIMLKNEDVLPAEFESNDLGKEKVIPGGSTLPLYLEALSPGKYQFFNDFHPSSTGTLVVEKGN